MEYFLRFAQPMLLALAIVLFLFCLIIRWMYPHVSVFKYSMVRMLSVMHCTSRHPYKKILWVIRFSVLALLVFLIGQPQLVDSRSKIEVEGINIVLVLDVSRSMTLQDSDSDTRTRFDIAKAEALRFIRLRHNDAIGLVFFGLDAVSRCPLTNDKIMLEKILHETEIGVVNGDGTALSRGMLTGLNRLRNADAKSNIMIVLTDGEPTPGDLNPKDVVEAAKQLGVKIYTIGIGSEEDTYVMHPFYGQLILPKVNKELLTSIAQHTGGKFFLAQNASDMRAIYDTINMLETTKIETPLFSNYYNIYLPWLWAAILLFALELLLSSLIWFGL